jgi:hypothetical protein
MQSIFRPVYEPVTKRLGQASSIRPVFYVNTLTGNDSNGGRTATSAKLTLAAAHSAIVALGNIGTIRITAPSTNPVLNLNFSSGNLIFESTDGSPWYTEFVLKRTSGWTLESGSIYSQSSGAAGNDPYIETLTDADGFFPRLSLNSSTPTTPANGQWGYTGGKWYVNLPAGENPNSHTIKFPAITRGWAISGGVSTFRNAYFRYAEAEGLIDTSNGAIVQAENCTFQYGGCGIEAINTSIVSCLNCLAVRNRNDGFNSRNTARIILNNCESSYNLDEGASNHNSSIFDITGGRYHHNGHGGITAIDSTTLNLYSVTVDYNGSTGPSQGERGGINYITTSSGVCQNCTCQNNTGEGFNCQSSGTVSVVNLTSGTGQGNTLADVTC